MQPIQKLTKVLNQLADPRRFLFSFSDLRAVVPGLTDSAFKSLLSRAVKQGILQRVCRGIYLYPVRGLESGLVLYRTAAILRAHEFNYLSLESVLSDAGVISQIPLNWITVMSTGRNNIISCGDWGHIEFIHTKRPLSSFEDQIEYDSTCGIWRGSVLLALQDMKRTRRSMDLVDWRIANELI